MLVKATKKMAAALNKVKPAGFDRVRYREVSPAYYPTVAMLTAEDYGDYNERTGKFKAIVIDYPPEDYAMPATIGTYELVKIAKRSGRKTFGEFATRFFEEMEI